MHGRQSLHFFLFAAGGVLLAAALILLACARAVPGFAQAYALRIYPVFKSTMGGLCSLLPVSVSEFGLYLLLLFCLYYIASHIRQPLFLASRGFFLGSLLFFVYMINCGVNYYRTPFSYEAGLTTAPASTEELYSLCKLLVEKINEEAAAVPERPSLSPYPGQTEDTPSPSWAYLRAMGRINAGLARRAERVVEVVCGIPLFLKGQPPAARENWKEKGGVTGCGS